MSDPTTPAKGLTQPTVGGDTNAWGGLLNTNLALIDSALGGTAGITISGNTTLTGTQVQNSGFEFAGSLSATAAITWPSFSGMAVIQNGTTGGHSITCGISGGTSVSVLNGETAAIWSDGTNFYRLAQVGGGATVSNSDLQNSSITIAGHTVSLGGSQALAASDLSNGVTGSGDVVLASGASLSGASFSGATITDSNVLDNTSLSKSANYTVANSDKGKTFALSGNVLFTLSFNATSSYDANFAVRVVNQDVSRGKCISLDGATFILWPSQAIDVYVQGNNWYRNPQFQRGSLQYGGSYGTFYVDTVNGTTNGVGVVDGLATSGAGCFKTIADALTTINNFIDCTAILPTIQIVAGSTITEQVQQQFTGQPIGSCQIEIIGNEGSPITWECTGNNQTLIETRDNGILTVKGFYFSANGYTGCQVVYAAQNGTLDHRSCNFGPFPNGYHISIGQGGSVNSIDGEDNPFAYIISGSAVSHIFMQGPCKHNMGGVSISVPNALTFTQGFVNAVGCAVLIWGTNAFSGPGSGSGSTGKKYEIVDNAVFYSGGTTEIPGATAGTTATGGLAY